MESGSWLHILRNIPNPALRKLKVTFRGSSLTYLRALGSSLLDGNIEQTLTSLVCCCMTKIPLTEAALRPFLSFGRLTKLELLSPCTERGCSFQLNDSIISELAAALPGLTHLALGGDPCKASTSGVTITSLVTLSTNCVDLELLRLRFDANDIISRDTYANPQTHKFTCKLRTLTVGSQPLSSNHDSILVVAFAIFHIFPHLEIISSANQGWHRVERAVQMFRKALRTIPPPTTS